METEVRGRHISDEHMKNYCVPDTALTCRYLTIGGGGWNCEKFSALKIILDNRVAEGTIRATGDNCPGWILPEKFKTKVESLGHPAGSIVYMLKGFDYGLASDDTRMTGIKHVSVTLDPAGGYPSFTIAESDCEPVGEE